MKSGETLVQVRLDASDHRRLKYLANGFRITQTEVIRKLIREWDPQYSREEIARRLVGLETRVGNLEGKKR